MRLWLSMQISGIFSSIADLVCLIRLEKKSEVLVKGEA